MEKLNMEGAEAGGEKTELTTQIEEMSFEDLANAVEEIVSKESFEKLMPLDLGVIRGVAADLSMENPSTTLRDVLLVAADRRINALKVLGERSSFGKYDDPDLYVINGHAVARGKTLGEAIRAAKDSVGD